MGDSSATNGKKHDESEEKRRKEEKEKLRSAFKAKRQSLQVNRKELEEVGRQEEEKLREQFKKKKSDRDLEVKKREQDEKEKLEEEKLRTKHRTKKEKGDDKDKEKGDDKDKDKDKEKKKRDTSERISSTTPTKSGGGTLKKAATSSNSTTPVKKSHHTSKTEKTFSHSEKSSTHDTTDSNKELERYKHLLEDKDKEIRKLNESVSQMQSEKQTLSEQLDSVVSGSDSSSTFTISNQIPKILTASKNQNNELISTLLNQVQNYTRIVELESQVSQLQTQLYDAKCLLGTVFCRYLCEHIIRSLETLHTSKNTNNQCSFPSSSHLDASGKTSSLSLFNHLGIHGNCPLKLNLNNFSVNEDLKKVWEKANEWVNGIGLEQFDTLYIPGLVFNEDERSILEAAAKSLGKNYEVLGSVV